MFFPLASPCSFLWPHPLPCPKAELAKALGRISEMDKRVAAAEVLTGQVSSPSSY